jgi:hypothetical protein
MEEETMKKFVVLHRKNTTTVQEVECEAVFCHPWEVKPGEAKYRLSAPEELKGEVWMSWFFHETQGDAEAKANIELRGEFERRATREHADFDETKFLEAVKAIKVSKL